MTVNITRDLLNQMNRRGFYHPGRYIFALRRGVFALRRGVFPMVLTFMVFHLSPGMILGQPKTHVLVVHGGAGVMEREKMSPERQQAYLYHLERALRTGDSVLRHGGTALDAVEATIVTLEECPLFNAGRGAVFSWEGKNELDASVMDGTTGHAGAVAGVTTIRNPIRAARAVMEKSPHVLLSGKGACAFAREQGLEMVSNRWFFTRERHDQLKSLKKRSRERSQNDNHGTVGCVALDQYGHLCAGTSTGGMTGKRFGRIGDTPLIGAGTWAGDATCGVSCTGHGEYFIRGNIAREVSARMEYLGESLEVASTRVLDKLIRAGGTGGFIALDARGNLVMPFNTSGMFRGYIRSNGEIETAIFAP